MKIELKNIKVRDLVKGYINNEEEGVIGFDGKLNIRPAYQREFVYKDKQRNAVIDTLMKGFPLNTMYWVRNEDDTFELLDGQQRTLSICSYINGDFSLNEMLFHNLTDDEQEQILDYDLMVYVCEGNDRERLDWFRTINIAGEKLTDQELLNINYIGEWLASAKQKFSKTNCIAYKIGNKYVKGSPIRQEYLETALDWISDGNIADYMAHHQHDKNANELWLYFNSVIEWINTTFGEKNYRKEMMGLNWGKLYNTYKDNAYDAKELEVEIKALMENEEVTDKKGIYEYVLSGKDSKLAKKLSKRLFSKSDIRTAYERQNGICPICGDHFELKDMQADHIVPWNKGGRTELSNLQMLCSHCNASKKDY